MASPSRMHTMDLAGLLQASGGDPTSDEDTPRTPFTAMLARNPHGWGWQPLEERYPMPRFTEEARSSQHPWSDYVAEKTGSLAAGRAVETALKFGRASGEVSAPRSSIGPAHEDAFRGRISRPVGSVSRP